MLRNSCFVFICLIFSIRSFAEDDKNLKDKSIKAGREGFAYLARFKAAKAFEKYDTAIYYARQVKDNEFLLGRSLLGSGQALWYMCDFARAIDSVNLAIRYLRMVKPLSESWELPSALRIASNLYDETGDYVKAFETVIESLEYADRTEDKQNIVLSLVQLGHLYYAIGDYATALVYYRQAQGHGPMRKSYPYREMHRQMGWLYAQRKIYDSALYHYRLALPGHPIPRNVNLCIGECYLLQGKTDTAYSYLKDVYPGALASGDVPIYTPAMIGLGKIYLASGQIDSALFMAKGALAIASEKGARQNIRDASLLLSQVYEKQKDSANAYLYYRQYALLKDSVLSDQFKGQLFSLKRKTEDERQQAQLRLLKWSVAGLSLIAVFVILVLLLRHRNEKLRLQQRSAELKMQALRAQMNPHFIFNCLSAINHFILNGEMDTASGYLTRFARLIRLVLVNSEKNRISLEEELDMLKHYLDMEKLRFKDAFDYHIRYDATIQPSMIQVPSFILQPFCENAIWHGLLHKEGKGELVIDLAMKNEVMICTITDNGIGIAKAAELKSRATEKQGSFGLALTTERLALFNNHTKASGSFHIEEITDANGGVKGTRVILSIKNKAV